MTLPRPLGPCLGRFAAELADGRVSGAAADRAWAHVAGCARCRDAVAAQGLARSVLHGVDAPPASEALLRRLADPLVLTGNPAAVAERPHGGSSSLPLPRRAGGPAGAAGRQHRVGRAVLTTAVGAGALALVAVAGGGPTAMIRTPTPSSPSGYVVPAVDRFVQAHAVETDRLTLTDPGADVLPVSAVSGSVVVPADGPRTP